MDPLKSYRKAKKEKQTSIFMWKNMSLFFFVLGKQDSF